MRSMTDEGWSREARRLWTYQIASKVEKHDARSVINFVQRANFGKVQSRLASLDDPSSDPTSSGHLPPQGGKETRFVSDAVELITCHLNSATAIPNAAQSTYLHLST